MATAKKATAAKTAAKPVKFAKGKEVRVKRAGLTVGVGKYLGADTKKNGVWHRVNMNPGVGRVADVRVYRAANLERV